MRLPTMQEEWKRYRDACYPKGLPADQNCECHQAFFGGALAVLSALDAIADLDDNAAVNALEEMRQETIEVCRARADTLKNRN